MLPPAQRAFSWDWKITGASWLEPEGLLEIVRAVKGPWLGVNLDTGNFHTEDPYADLAKIAPYAVNVQLKVELKRLGQKAGKPTDLARVVTILRDANYQGFVALEYEAKPDPWQAVPPVLKRMKELFAAQQPRERGPDFHSALVIQRSHRACLG